MAATPRAVPPLRQVGTQPNNRLHLTPESAFVCGVPHAVLLPDEGEAQRVQAPRLLDHQLETATGNGAASPRQPSL